MNASKGFAPHSITIKNTFVEYAKDGTYETDEVGADEGDFAVGKIPKRQQSEPAPAMKFDSAEHFMYGERSDSSEPEQESSPGTTYDELPGVEGSDASRTCGSDSSSNYCNNAMTDSSCRMPPLLPTASSQLPMPSLPNDMNTGTGAGLVMDIAAFSNPTSMLAANALAAANGISVPSHLMWTNVHTVMLRNIPSKVSQQVLLQELDNCGFENSYDFLYLPIDPETNANRGYAFINFVNTELAMMFRMFFEGRKFANYRSDKVMSTVPAALQGFEANHAHYSKARVNQRELGARPLFLRDPQVAKDVMKRRNKPDSLIDIAARKLREKQQGDQRTMQPHMRQTPPQSIKETGSTKGQATAKTKMPRFCHDCGSGIRYDFKFCQNCGVAISV
jgi:hypothetical protein